MIAFWFLAFLLAGDDLPPSVVVIAHPDVPIDRLEEGQLADIFLGKRMHWEESRPISPVVLREGSVHEQFLDLYLGTSAELFERYWIHAIFIGRERPPRMVGKERISMAYVANTPGAIGYVAKGMALEGVKTLEIVRSSH